VARRGPPTDDPPGRRRRGEERTIEQPNHDEGGAAETAATSGRAPVPPPYAPPHAGLAAGPDPSQAGPASRAPLVPAGTSPVPPPTADARACWGWGLSLAGVLVGFGPELLLYLAALGMGTSTNVGKVTVGSAVALVAGSLVLYGWQTLTAWFFSLRITGRRLALWGFTTPNKAFFWTIPVALAAVYLVSFLHDLVVHPKQQDIIGEFPHTLAGVVLFVILAVFMAPFFEEIFFRGFLFRGFSASWGWIAGACVSAAIFGLAHLQLDVFVPLFALGIALAWVYKRTGSLWTCIAFHALFNALSVLAWALSG
jgi:membrane protease YdiL (CAAX protease family)